MFWIEYFTERKISNTYKYWWDRSNYNSTNFNVEHLHVVWWSQRYDACPVMLASMRYNWLKHDSSYGNKFIANDN